MSTEGTKNGLVLLLWACAALAFGADDPTALQQKIDAARAKLDAAARELAELHKQSGFALQPAVPTRSSLGVLLMPGNGAGVSVAGVTPGGAAADVGIEAGDVIVAIDGASLRGADAPPLAKFLDAMKDVAPGDLVHVDYLRNGEASSADITAQEPLPQPAGGFAVSTMAFTAGEPAATSDIAVAGQIALPAPPFAGRAMVGGLELFDVGADLGRYFGVTDGVLVLRAPLDKAGSGLAAGDVIKAVDGHAVASSSECISELMRDAGERTIDVVRDGATVSVHMRSPRGPTTIALPPPSGNVQMREPRDAEADGPKFDVMFARPIAE